MIEIIGKYGTAKVFIDNIDIATRKQLERYCDEEISASAKIRIMPDCHAGKGSVIGTTMELYDRRVIPSVVGVDIGCGMRVLELDDHDVDFEKLDNFIRQNIPHGHKNRSSLHSIADYYDMDKLNCWDLIKDRKDVQKDPRIAIGTLGGGNHFIEMDKNKDGNLILVIHTGSRNLGLQIAQHYKRIANETHPEVDDMFGYVEGDDFGSYIHDMTLGMAFARLNRKAIGEDIVNGMGFTVNKVWETLHNYIDTDDMIVRKGAISAKKGERAIIPMNMRDGSLIVIGKGNPEWNFSAPHGAGRLFGIKDAKKKLSMKEFKESMADIYTTSVTSSVIHESPQAYKPMDDIVNNIGDTCQIVDIIKPVYNFKAL